MATDAQMSDHVSKVRAAAGQLLAAIDALDALKTEWDYADLGNQLPTDLASVGHPGLSKTDIANGYNSSAAIRGLLDQGHGTNLVKIK